MKLLFSIYAMKIANVCVCECMCVCVCVCVCMHMQVRAPTCMHARTHSHMDIYMCPGMYMQLKVNVRCQTSPSILFEPGSLVVLLLCVPG